jgi:5-methylcytosine-specific restriction endonuclease McrA
MPLKTIKPRLAATRMYGAKPQPNEIDPYYRSRGWLALRRQALARDHYQCTAPGCANKASVADHIISQRDGGADALANLRSLCLSSDAKQRPRNKRTGRGVP